MTIDFDVSQLTPLNHIALPNIPKGHASVLVPLLQRDGQWHLLLTLRASHLRNHGGEVAFPGGMWEPLDESPMATALRESEEEIALPIHQVKVLGGLDELSTRGTTWVRPIVGVIPDTVSLEANKNEIASIFSVPLAFFKEDRRLRTDCFKRIVRGSNVTYWVPAYQFGDYEIWGFTATVIMRLMNQCFGANIGRANSAPEKIW